MPSPRPDSLLDEQVAYYRAIAPEYEAHAIDEPGADELFAAIDAFDVRGNVLELASGPGFWTERLVGRAATLTAVDASPEMIARAKARVGDERVRFIQADLFSWEPDRRYDLVFFGFWLSHVPMDRFDAFWAKLARALEPGGQVFFVDDNWRTPQELIEGAGSSTVERKLKDGTAFRAVKVPHAPAELQERLRGLGWRATVHTTAGPFYWGSGAAPG